MFDSYKTFDLIDSILIYLVLIMQQKLALFDFDGTITKKDSFFEFIKYYKGLRRFYTGLIFLSPFLLLYKAGIIKNWWTKELVFTFFFKNEPYGNFKKRCKEFSSNVIPELINPAALVSIKTHIKNGDRVIIVTASFEDTLIDWCKSMQVELVGTKILTKEDLVTGKIDGKNCYGIEKVTRLNQFIDIGQFTEIYAYGDSKGDLPMLALADHKFYRSFKE
jgi:phosphatidylglycerophosphatase C